jgi:ABC-type transporter Mla maintaining outer membrane lipid asymmetry ATPase subunit MlaF
MKFEFDGLTVRFGSQVVLDKLSESIEGKALAIIGPSGGGKSTLLRVLGVCYRPMKESLRLTDIGSRTKSNSSMSIVSKSALFFKAMGCFRIFQHSKILRFR